MAADEGSSRKRHKSDDAEKPTLKFRNYVPQVRSPLSATTTSREREGGRSPLASRGPRPRPRRARRALYPLPARAGPDAQGPIAARRAGEAARDGAGARAAPADGGAPRPAEGRALIRQELEAEERENGGNALNIAREANWDLKRDIEKACETPRARARLSRGARARGGRVSTAGGGGGEESRARGVTGVAPAPPARFPRAGCCRWPS